VQYTSGTQQVQRPTVEPENIMKTVNFFKTLAIGTAVVAALSATVIAQAGPGYGPGAGMGPMGNQQMVQGQGDVGPDGRPAQAMRGGQMQGQRVGQSLLTPEERSANQARMAAAKTYEECKAVQAEQHAAMVTRATEKGITLPAPQSRSCDMRKARGFFAS